MPLLTDPSALIRLTTAHFADGISAIANTSDAAQIAADLFDQEGDMPNFAGLSALMVVWGQFVDHDLSLTRDASGEMVQVAGLVAPLQRSVFDPDSGTSAENPRVPVNEITPQMDASMIYGSTEARTTALRTFEEGKLEMGEVSASGRALMALSSDDHFMAGTGAAGGPVFLAGDIRANENIALTALHTVFSREHNYWAERLAAQNPDWDDATLFEAARAIVEYEVQAITYRDWIDKLLLETPLAASPLAPTTGTEVGQVSVEFSTAAFRIGHTMVPTAVRALAESGANTQDEPLAVEDIFFNPALLHEGFLDDLLRGQMATLAQEVDGKIIDDLNFFLRAPDGLSGFSLAALNILRGRDHGLDSYLEVRAALIGDVDPAAVDPSDFSVITQDIGQQAALAAVYDRVQDVDLWVGGLIEDRLAGAQVGPVFSHILADQFFRTRAADSSFMMLPETLSGDILEEVQEAKLRDILLRNTEIEVLQEDPFLAMDRLAGTDKNDVLAGTDAGEMIFGLWGYDQITGAGGDDIIYGGPQLDVAVYGATRSAYWVAVEQDAVRITDKRAEGDGRDYLAEVETLSFLDEDWSVDDVSAVFDLSAADLCGIIEIYIAYFDRAPDTSGLIFWATAYAGGMPLEEIAAYFHDQDETRLSYPDPTDASGFVSSVYVNVLGRAVDQGGLDFWTAMLESGAVAQADFVMSFLDGTRAPIQPDETAEFQAEKAQDRAFLKNKVDLGMYFGVIKGMSDVSDGHKMMDIYDGTQDSLMQAAGKIDMMFAAAMTPDSGDVLLSLIGLADDPFVGLMV
jgi:hypothetical protein